MAGKRGPNQKYVRLVARAIQDHPGDDPWNSTDLSIWTQRLAVDEGLARGVSPKAIDVLIAVDPGLRDLANKGLVALTEHQSSKSKDPEWYARVTDRNLVVRAPKGRAVAAILTEYEEKAAMIEDKDARKEYLELAKKQLGLFTASPSQRMQFLVEADETGFNVSNRTSALSAEVAEQREEMKQIKSMLAVNNQLMLEFIRSQGGDAPATQPGARPRPRPAAAEHAPQTH